MKALTPGLPGENMTGSSGTVEPVTQRALLGSGSRRSLLRAAAALIAGAMILPASSAFASTPYPTKPIKVIVPFPGGGTLDYIVRLVGQKLTEKWGQPIIVENRPGAGTIIGVEAASRAPGDGYTLVAVANSFTVNATLQPKLPYDTLKDFAPITLLADTPHVLVAHPSVPAKTLAELIKLAKEKPGSLSYGSFGIGTTPHLAGEMLKSRAGINIVHVPYKGIGPGITDLVGGHIHLMFGNFPDVMPLVEAGKLHAIAITDLERSPLAPNLQTVASEGMPGFTTNSWFGLQAPKGTPPEIVAKLNEEIRRILALPEISKSLAEKGFRTASTSPDEFAAFLRKEIEIYAKIIKDADIRIQ